jgi:hypothetical protein
MGPFFYFGSGPLGGLYEGLETLQGGRVGCRGLVSIVTHVLLTYLACDLPLRAVECREL